jgi:hypothetical protein
VFGVCCLLSAVCCLLSAVCCLLIGSARGIREDDVSYEQGRGREKGEKVFANSRVEGGRNRE